MKELNLTEAFCEVLSGLGLIIFLVPLLDLFGIFPLERFMGVLTANLTIASLSALFLIAYFLGAGIVDAIGLASDRILEAYLPKDTVSAAERVAFWSKVQEHVLEYRNHQWTYYSCYRNLFVMFAPGGICWAILVGQHAGWYAGIAVIVSVALLEAALFKSMIALLKLYRDITTAVGAPAS